MNFFKKNKLLLSAVAIIVAIVALDLLTKVLAENYLTGTVEIIGKWMTLHFITNGGASFSFLDGFVGSNVVFFIVTIIGLPLMMVVLYFNRKNSLFGNLGLVFMIGGTIGNAIDRAFLGDGFFNGRVRDFISVKGFAIFNVADIFLVCGVIMFIFALMFLEKDALFAKKDKKDE